MKRLLAAFLGLFFANGMAVEAPLPAPQLIIDVRTAEEFNAGHLDSAVNIPYDIIEKKIAKFAPNTNTIIMLYCRSGRRSGIAIEKLEKLGYKNLINGGGYKEMLKKTKK
jgi:phage shock protein E